MKPTLAYAPRSGPLGTARPSVAAIYLAPLVVLTFAVSNPIVLAAVGGAALLIAIGSGALRATLGPLRFGAYLALTVVVVNVIVSQRGETILLRGGEVPLLGQIDVSLEALAEGGVLALRIGVALAVFAIWSACVDPDRILRGIRPWASRSALTATVITRLVPLAAADHQRLSAAAGLRGPAASPVGRAAMARRLIAGSLDRSVDVAATLELRGYGLGIRPRVERPPLAPGELALLGSALAMVVLAAAAAAAGVIGFSAYPRIVIDAGPATLAFAFALPAVALAPFATSPRARALLSGGGPAPEVDRV